MYINSLFNFSYKNGNISGKNGIIFIPTDLKINIKAIITKLCRSCKLLSRNIAINELIAILMIIYL